MCRITLTTEGLAVAERIAHLQRNGGTLPAEFCTAGGCAVGLNRFTVTSAKSPHGVFPLESSRYLLAFNGEVYGFRDRAFVNESSFESDGHFAMELLLEHGIETFFKEADFQGTFLVFDKQKEQWWCVVDQMNIAGCFYAAWGKKLIIASESAPIHQVLTELGVDEKVPIELLLPGRALVRECTGEVTEKILRPQGLNLYSQESLSNDAFERFYSGFSQALTESIRRRIPVDGPVGVLCSGGIDSSVVLAVTVKFLRESNQLERLKIFTLASDSAEMIQGELDIYYVVVLLKSLNLDPKKYLTVISAESIEPIKMGLLRRYVFADSPRLITPNPILRSQVRNTIMMSSLLCKIKEDHGEIISMLTGDAADELMAGYAEMLQSKVTQRQVREEVILRVANFPMTDGARVSLASFFGSTAAKWLTQPGAESSPVEIRMPFSSHLFMEALSEANVDFLFGEIDGVRVNKFPLRLFGADLNIPKEIITRQKIPFNEGGTGTKNGEPSRIEQNAALEWMRARGLTCNSPEIIAVRKLYNLPPEEAPEYDQMPGLTDQMALVLAAGASGAARLFLGKIFQAQPTAPPKGSESYFPAVYRSI